MPVNGVLANDYDPDNLLIAVVNPTQRGERVGSRFLSEAVDRAK